VRMVIGLGGNALLRRGQPLEATLQRENIEAAARSIAEVAREHDVVLTHGNGPQVGLLALQSEAYAPVHPYPLDVLGAESQGMIGYLLEQALGNKLPDHRFASLLTQVTVRADDPALQQPNKPVGPMYREAEALRIAAERGWTVAQDGNGYRRVVPSPEPVEIVEIKAIRLLVESGFLVICVGGGGIPSMVGEDGRRHGIEAVIDKDLSASLLASQLGAEFLMLLTDVPAVEAKWGTPLATPIRQTTVGEMRRRRFSPGSMGPKVEAACRFVEATGKSAGIGSLVDAFSILRGEAGTQICR
jgi:carbamate kinase